MTCHAALGLVAMLVVVTLSPLVHGAEPTRPSVIDTPAIARTVEDWALVANGGAIVIDLDETSVTLELTLNHGGRPSHILDADGNTVPFDHVTLLEGTVRDDPDSTVRITWSATRVLGHIWSSHGHSTVTTDTDGHVHGKHDTTIRAAAVPRPTSPELAANSEPPQPLAGCRGIPPHALAHPAGLVTGWPTRTYDVAFAVDDTFRTAYPDWTFEALDLINALDGQFTRQLDLRVHPVDLRLLNTDVITAPDVETQLIEFRHHYDTELVDLEREAAHLFSGSATGFAAGIAACLGGAGDPGLAYSVSRHREDFEPFGIRIAPDEGLKIAAHEMAHVLGANHNYKTCAEAAMGIGPDRPADVCTLMTEDTLAISLEISSLNRLVTRGFAERAHL